MKKDTRDRREWRKDYYLRNKETILAKRTVYRNKNREIINKKKRGAQPEKRWAEFIKGRYGITSEQYHEILASQGGGCAICGTTVCQTGRRLCVDHDHQTGKVRGILCTACNAVLGYSSDTPDILRRAIAYLNANE